ncbi:MAG: EAL domain-containing protein [Lachnospiraceae bacterium]|nr:EAL domain-containing protein [Lachnospiraceae bacterium]
MANTKTVLIVDGSSSDRGNVAAFLEDYYNVIDTGSTSEAYGILNVDHKNIGAVILDITSDGTYGEEMLNFMKKEENLSNIPVIMTADTESEETEISALSAGASDFLYKPYSPVIVKKRLDNIIKLNENASMANDLQKDRLTGVCPEEVFCQKVTRLLEENPSVDYAIVYSDIENFGLIKDLFGENAGNNILVYMARVFKHFISKDELCGRLETGNFVLFLKYDKETLDENLESVVKIINDFPVSMNIMLRFGVYKIEDRTMPVQAMSGRAVLTAGTIRGRYGQYVAYYNKEIWEKQMYEQEIIDCMEDALRQKQFMVYFQPKYDLGSERVAGAEALVRWQHPSKGFMNPAEFIPIFEKNGFITELDKYVWDTTCCYIETWIKNGYPVVPVSVNVSRTDIYNPDFIEIILGIIHKHNLEPENIHLEITETAYTDNPEQIIEVVKQLKLLGFVIEMDDFGSGYSSLNMLNELPIDILKLDMGFVQDDMGTNSNNILSFIIGLAKWMDYAVVAEGIETEEQIQILRNMDCNFVQGYYYAQPMPPDEFEAYMLRHNILDRIDEIPDAGMEEFKFEKSQGVMLIVDDLALNRKILSTSFSSYFKIVEKENGAEAFEYIKKNYKNIDVIMLDLVMPVMDGFTLMRHIGSDEKYKNIPIIVTSQGGEKSVGKAFSLGASDFVEKPYNLRIILHRVQNVVMASRKQKDIEI